MGRPSLPVGTFGKIGFVEQSSGEIQARARFRDYDGQTRLVSKIGRSRAAAERALKAELLSRQAPGGNSAVRSSMRVEALADVWLASAHGWSTGTERTYRSVINKQVKPALGQLRVQEVTPGVISRAIAAIAKSSGPGAAKSTRACLSGMFGVAILDGAVAINPVRDAVARVAMGKRSPRALTVAETERLTSWLRADGHSVALDLPDLVDWMLATGCRIGEALALRYGLNGDGKPLLDVDTGTWEINATVVRVAGQGLIVQPRPKTAAGWRVVALPEFARQMLGSRLEPGGARGAESLVFTAPLARGLRDPTNVSGDLRQLLDSIDCKACACTGFQLEADGSLQIGPGGRRVRCATGPWSWVTSHTFRKTVATRLDEAGFTARQVADQLGHANPSMTLDVYFGRQVVSSTAAQVLNR